MTLDTVAVETYALRAISLMSMGNEKRTSATEPYFSTAYGPKTLFLAREGLRVQSWQTFAHAVRAADS